MRTSLKLRMNLRMLHVVYVAAMLVCFTTNHSAPRDTVKRLLSAVQRMRMPDGRLPLKQV